MPRFVDPKERRSSRRFPLRRKLRYRILQSGRWIDPGTGLTSDMSSEGIAFTADRLLLPGAFIELSVSWPVSLENGCPLQLVAMGRIVRCLGMLVVCTLQKVEFRSEERRGR